MTTPKTTYGQGQAVTRKSDGQKFVVKVHNEGSNAVHVATEKGVEPYVETWVNVDDLKASSKGRGSRSSDPSPAPVPAPAPQPAAPVVEQPATLPAPADQ